MLNFLARAALKHRLGYRPFTIVSNNCWGAHVYLSAGLPFLTPFIGLFIAPQDYVDLVGDFRAQIRKPIRFKSISRHGYINEMRALQSKPHPIGVLGDGIEIQFLHYETPEEASEKWRRRLSRVADDDSTLFFKFCDRDGCTREQLMAFHQIPHSSKVAFVSRKHVGIESQVVIPGNAGQVPDGLSLSRISGEYFDAAQWISSASGFTSRIKWPRV